MARRFHVADRAPRRQVGDVLRDVRPGLAAVPRQLQQAVVRAGPDDSRLFWRFCNREDDAPVLDPDVVGRQAAGALLPALVVQREVRTDLLPALTAVGRLVHVLAADVDSVPIVRRDRKRRRPHESILQIRRYAVGIVRPHFDIARLAPVLFIANDDAADAAGS